MKHIVRFESYTSEERLDDVLDKISKYGKGCLTNLELRFLDSYSNGNPDDVHNEIKFTENETTFEDDQGNFKFEFRETINNQDETIYVGTIYVPDLSLKGKVIEGNISGNIIKYKNGNIALEFQKGIHDIFEFCNGLEYELDSFIDYIISEIDQKMDIKD